MGLLGYIGLYVAGPLLLLGMILRPGEHHEAALELSMIHASQSRWVVSHVVMVAAIVLFIPALAALASGAAARSRKAAIGGLLLGWLGCGGWFGSIALELAVGPIARLQNTDGIRVYDDIITSPSVFIPTFFLSSALSMAIVALAILGIRSRKNFSSAAILALGGIVLGLGGPASSELAWVAGSGLLTAGMWLTARRMKIDSPEEIK